MRLPLAALLALAAVTFDLKAQISVIPIPASLTPKSGHFTLSPRTSIRSTRGTAALGRQLAGYLEPQFVKHVLGAQGQLWTEYMKDSRHVEYMAFPRVSALSEVVWTPKTAKDFADLSARLKTHLRRLQILDVNYRALEP